MTRAEYYDVGNIEKGCDEIKILGPKKLCANC
jgi:hypothetical protein